MNIHKSSKLLVHYSQIETRLASINSELFVISCFDDRPDIQMEFAELTGGGRRAEAIDLEEFVRRCIIGAVLNFSLGELLYPDTETSARVGKSGGEYLLMEIIVAGFARPSKRRISEP